MPDTASADEQSTTGRQRALWASTAARGGIATFISTMQDTPLWQDWGIRLVSTHSNGPALSRIATFAKALVAYITELVFNRPQVVHLHTAAYGSFARKGLLGLIAKVFRLPVILHMHGADFLTFYHDAPKPLRSVIRVTLERADAVVALGDAWASQLRLIAPMAKITVVPNAVSPQSLVSQQVEGPVNVTFLGEIGDRKGTFTLLDAWAKMLADSAAPAQARLRIIGDGEVDRARDRVAELGLGTSVDVHGWMAHDEAKEVLSLSHILVLPSRDEGQPMAILEAMARGLCVVATTVGGIPELLGDGCGVLIKPDDVDGLASEMAFVIADGEARATYGARSLQRVRDRFDVEVVSRRFDELYHKLT